MEAAQARERAGSSGLSAADHLRQRIYNIIVAAADAL
jgi:hypothetical protein